MTQVHITTPYTTVADESEEIAAEASTSAVKTEGEEIKEEVKEEKIDPNALPEDACVTLYLQNLNEKVRIPG
jgi:U2 small nuclear ribonucleoprotein B''